MSPDYSICIRTKCESRYSSGENQRKRIGAEAEQEEPGRRFGGRVLDFYRIDYFLWANRNSVRSPSARFLSIIKTPVGF
jgi:hypothetical protein